MKANVIIKQIPIKNIAMHHGKNEILDLDRVRMGFFKKT